MRHRTKEPGARGPVLGMVPAGGHHQAASRKLGVRTCVHGLHATPEDHEALQDQVRHRASLGLVPAR